MLKLASTAGLAAVVFNLKQRARAVAFKGAAGFIGALLSIIALVFFLVAAHAWLSRHFGPMGSAAMIGGLLLLISLIFFYAASRPLKPLAQDFAEARADVGDAVNEGWLRLARMAGSSYSPLRNPVFQAASLALLAGVFLGRRTKR